MLKEIKWILPFYCFPKSKESHNVDIDRFSLKFSSICAHSPVQKPAFTGECKVLYVVHTIKVNCAQGINIYTIFHFESLSLGARVSPSSLSQKRQMRSRRFYAILAQHIFSHTQQPKISLFCPFAMCTFSFFLVLSQYFFLCQWINHLRNEKCTRINFRCSILHLYFGMVKSVAQFEYNKVRFKWFKLKVMPKWEKKYTKKKLSTRIATVVGQINPHAQFRHTHKNPFIQRRIDCKRYTISQFIPSFQFPKCMEPYLFITHAPCTQSFASLRLWRYRENKPMNVALFSTRTKKTIDDGSLISHAEDRKKKHVRFFD